MLEFYRVWQNFQNNNVFLIFHACKWIEEYVCRRQGVRAIFSIKYYVKQLGVNKKWRSMDVIEFLLIYLNYMRNKRIYNSQCHSHIPWPSSSSTYFSNSNSPCRYHLTWGSGDPPMLEQVSSWRFPSVTVTCELGAMAGSWGAVRTVRVYFWTCRLAPEPPALTLHSNLPLSRS